MASQLKGCNFSLFVSLIIQLLRYSILTNPCCGVLFQVASAALIVTDNNSNPSSFSSGISIERITTQERCLDVAAFRLLSIRSDIKSDDSILHDSSEIIAIKEEICSKPKALECYEVNGGDIIQFVVTQRKQQKLSDEQSSIQILGTAEAQFVPSKRGLRSFDLPNSIHLKNLRVDQRYRRMGVASALVSKIIQYACKETNHSKNIKAVTLEVERESNPNAVALYKKMGFTFHEEVYKGFMMKRLD